MVYNHESHSQGVACPALPETEAHVDLQLLNGGSFTGTWDTINSGAKADEFRLYNWCFFIYSRAKDRRILWDLGLTAVCQIIPSKTLLQVLYR